MDKKPYMGKISHHGTQEIKVKPVKHPAKNKVKTGQDLRTGK